MSEQTRWEYRTYNVHIDLSKQYREQPTNLPGSYDEWLAELNALGKDGWEAVAMLNTYSAEGTYPSVSLLLKRQLLRTLAMPDA